MTVNRGGANTRTTASEMGFAPKVTINKSNDDLTKSVYKIIEMSDGGAKVVDDSGNESTLPYATLITYNIVNHTMKASERQNERPHGRCFFDLPLNIFCILF